MLFPYAETLVPESTGEASAEDRAVRVFIQKWSTDPALLAANVTFVLVTENLADVSSRIVRSPQTVEIEVRRPDEAERLQFLGPSATAMVQDAFRPATRPAGADDLGTDPHPDPPDPLVGRRAPRPGSIVKALREQKKAVIEAECYGLLEYVESRFGLDMVSGHDGVKARLRRAAQAMAAGRLGGVPMGYLIAGPVGLAKTFLVNCFTGEIGFPCVKFLNFRSQWQGVTEGNLEKILKVLHAMWPVGVIIDEADAFLGDRNQHGDSGTSNRVFAPLASFMGNTEYRGKIVWFLITSRPDLLPVDLKRQGRAEGRAVDEDADLVRRDHPVHDAARREDRRRPAGGEEKAIAELGYGANAKVMVGFRARPWEGGYAGNVYRRAVPARLGRQLPPARRRRGLDVCSPAASSAIDAGQGPADEVAAAAARDRARLSLAPSSQRNGKVSRFHWPTYPWTKGAYACYKPGQWTTIAGAEGTAGRQPLLRRRALQLRFPGLHERRRPDRRRRGQGGDGRRQPAQGGAAVLAPRAGTGGLIRRRPRPVGRRTSTQSEDVCD